MRNKAFHSNLRLLVKSSFVVFIGLAISKLIGFFYRIVIAKNFGAEIYGLFSLTLMIVGWFVAFATIGFGDGLSRFIPFYRGKGEKEKIKYLFRYSLKTLTISGLIGSILLYLLAGFFSYSVFHNAQLFPFLRIFSVFILLSTLLTSFLLAIRAHEEIGWYSFIYNISQNLAKIVLIYLFIYLGFGFNAINFSYISGMVVMIILSIYVCNKKLKYIFEKDKLKEKERSKVKKEFMSYSIPVMFFGIISIIFYWIDTASLGYYKTALEVGYYNAAVPIAVLLGIAPELIMQLFFPLINKEYGKKNIKLIEQLGKQVTKWIFIVNIPLFALILFFPGAIIHVLFGSEFLIAESALRILATSALISSIFITSNQFVSMVGKSKLVLMNVIIAAIINFVLNSIFIPMNKIWFIENVSGLNGAALATLISILVFNLLFVIQTKIFLGIIPLRRKMLNVLISGIIATGALYITREFVTSNDLLTLALLGFSYLPFYFLLILLTKSLDDNDTMIANTVLKKIGIEKEIKF